MCATIVAGKEQMEPDKIAPDAAEAVSNIPMGRVISEAELAALIHGCKLIRAIASQIQDMCIKVVSTTSVPANKEVLAAIIVPEGK